MLSRAPRLSGPRAGPGTNPSAIAATSPALPNVDNIPPVQSSYCWWRPQPGTHIHRYCGLLVFGDIGFPACIYTPGEGSIAWSGLAAIGSRIGNAWRCIFSIVFFPFWSWLNWVLLKLGWVSISMMGLTVRERERGAVRMKSGSEKERNYREKVQRKGKYKPTVWWKVNLVNSNQW